MKSGFYIISSWHGLTDYDIKITNTRTTKITNNEGGAYDGNYIGDWEIRADAENKYRFTKD